MTAHVSRSGRWLALAGGGKLVVGAYVSTSGHRKFGVARFKKGGASDPTFGGGDGVADPFFPPGESVAYGVAVQSNGRIVIAGNAAANATTHGFRVERFLG